MKLIIQIIITALMLSALSVVKADKYHHHPLVLDVNEVTNVTEITEYTHDKCQGVPLAMAVGNNQMHLGTHKPQASVGIGECGGDVAGSLMFGMKPCKNCPMVNGSWGFDEDVNAFGLGATFVFK